MLDYFSKREVFYQSLDRWVLVDRAQVQYSWLCHMTLEVTPNTQQFSHPTVLQVPGNFWSLVKIKSEGKNMEKEKSLAEKICQLFKWSFIIDSMFWIILVFQSNFFI